MPYPIPVFRQFMHKTTHTVLTWVMLWLAYLFLGNNTFAGNSSFDAFASFSMSEHEWGVLAACVATVGLLTTFTTNWIARTLSAALLSVAHFCVAMLFYTGNPYAAATGPFVGYAILGAALAYSTAHMAVRSHLASGVETIDPSG